MAKLTKEGMLTRERMRLNSMDRLELFDELYGDTHSELVDALMETYEEEIDANEVVSCCDCGVDCIPGEDAEGYEDTWYCEDCADEDDDDDDDETHCGSTSDDDT